MNSVTMKTAFFGMLGATVLLVGCSGGGGDGDSGFTVPSIPSTAVSLNAANAEVVAGDAYAAIEGTQDAAGFVPLGVVVETTEVNLKKIVTDKIREVIAKGPSVVNSDTAVAVAVNESEACSYYDNNSGMNIPSGNISVTGNVSDPNAVNDGGGVWTSGDQATISFNSCALGFLNWKINGRINLVINADFDPSAVEDPSQCISISGCNADIQVTITNLTLSIGQAAITMHGAFNLAWNITPTSWTETLSGDSLYLVVSGGGQNTATEVSSFNIASMVDFTSETYSVNGTATVASTVANGSVAITAAYGGTAMVYIDSATGYIDDVDIMDPSSGTITITGNNSSIVVTSQVDAVTIEVDEDGVGGFDGAPIVTTWSAID